MFIYEFCDIYEMNFIHTKATIKAKDLHEAMKIFYTKYSSYDAIMVNGQWI